MAADSRKTTSEMLISRRPKKNRSRANAIAGTGNRHPIIAGAPDRSPILVKPKTEPAGVAMAPRKVPVLYYLTRNGHLEHPHLIDVPLSSYHGLYLRDVLNTLNHHRGSGMANMYSWSFKRSYKTGYVWHDLSDDDLIESTNGSDYVLKGSELLETHASQNPTETTMQTGDDCTSTTTAAAAAMIKRRNQSWSSFDNPQEYMVVKCESSRELAAKFAADAATQTEEQRKRRSSERGERITLGREETPSPPPSNSSSEISEGVSARRYIDPTANVRNKDLTAEDQHDASGRMKASEFVMQLITCGVNKSILD